MSKTSKKSQPRKKVSPTKATPDTSESDGKVGQVQEQSNGHDEAEQRNTENGLPKIWVTNDWYLEVSEDGYVSQCLEGTLGCVIPLHSKSNVNSGLKLALKIPRMLADTDRENAYICELTKIEAKNVFKAQSKGGAGLLKPEISARTPLVGRRATQFAESASARPAHGSIVFVCFEKGMRPRFLCINGDEKNAAIAPNGKKPTKATKRGFSLTQCEDAISKKWAALVKDSKNDDEEIDFLHTVKITLDPTATISHRLKSSLDIRRAPTVWYGSLPSIIYEWSDRNLQQAIGDGNLSLWSYDDYFNLFDSIALGLQSLHKCGLLHCDIRPANVMCVGDEPANSRSYRLGDYGSFSDEQPAGGGASGQTVVAPNVTRQRVGPFYSKERLSLIHI